MPRSVVIARRRATRAAVTILIGTLLGGCGSSGGGAAKAPPLEAAKPARSHGHEERQAVLVVGARTQQPGATSSGATPSADEFAAGTAGGTQCQQPVTTGVEVFDLRNLSAGRACRVALALYRWEEQGKENREHLLFGCHGTADLYPYLRIHSFEGWHLSVRRPLLSHGYMSFDVIGTDFPFSCP
jgi:hypothetical protein